MAGRDINIPFGPDKTGGFDLSSLIPEVEPSSSDDGAADVSDEPIEVEAATEIAARPRGATERFSPIDAGADESGSEPREGVPTLRDDRSEADAASDQLADALMDEAGDAQGADGESAASAAAAAAAGALAGVQSSLAALKDSIDQGRELKAREKQRDSFGEKLAIDKEELADREDILARYFELVDEQDRIIYESTQRRESLKSELSQVMAQQGETTDALQRMRDYNDSQLEPVEAALGRAKATAEQAKNDERSRKSELSAAESDVRRSEGGEEAGMAQAKYELVLQAHDEALARSEAAKEALDHVQKQYDDLRDQIEQAEAPLERSIEDLTKQADELKEEVNRLGDVISDARKRRQYCDNVYQYPDETAKLRASVEADEETARQMDAENDELRDLLADSKERSKVAKIGIVAVIVLIIVIVIAVVMLGR